MKNKHYLLSKYRYVAKKNNQYKDYDYDEIVELEYQHRLNSSSAIFVDFNIHPFSKIKQVRLTSEKYPLFFMILPEHLSMIQEIINNSKIINEKLNLLPDVAKTNISISQMVTEIKSSNDIEGVKSTRKEIEESVQAKDSKKEIRFKSTVRQYFNTLYSEKPYIHSLERIRELYDDIVLDEIEKENYPDGKLFRDKEVFISNLLYSERVHAGSINEDEIIENLTQLINYMNSENESDIIKAIVSHYIFEYIHPFYDGNGRLGRYILSSYLAYKLDPFSALSISESIKNDKKKYEDAFMEVTNPANKGELTFFISDMMKLIIKGQKNIIILLEEAIHKMDLAWKYVNSQKFNNLENMIIFIMLQHILFSYSNKYMTNMEIFENVKDNQYSRYKVDKALKELEERGYVRKISLNPISYMLITEDLPNFD